MTDQTQSLREACRIHTAFAVNRYLMACTSSRADGAEKALRHRELCAFYVGAVRGVDPERAQREHWDDYKAVHEATQALTDYLDEQIGFPIDGWPDYDTLAPKFFEKFHTLAMQALSAPAQPANGEVDPCPGCEKGYVCRKQTCGRLALPQNHPYRTTHPTPEALADQCDESAQAWANEIDTRTKAAAMLRTLSAELAAAMSEVEAQKLDYQRLMDKHNALHINAARDRAEVGGLRGAITHFCLGQKWAVDGWKAQAHIKPLFDIHAAPPVAEGE
jgi:hypothetical protein